MFYAVLSKLYSSVYLCCSGLIELVARISCLGKLAAIPSNAGSGPVVPSVASIETLLRVMDASGGKEKLIRSDRRSVAVRQFKFLKAS